MTATPETEQPRRRHATGEGAMIRHRVRTGLWVAIGLAAAAGAAWLIWQAPHCRPVAAHAYYTPTERCIR